MCRIAGVASGKLHQEEMRKKVSVMCTAQKHGGPDDEGIFSDVQHKVVFGHRRLAIIDLSSKGHQPMCDINNSAWITFNGEIYNYPELKNELIKLGAQFKSDTDTEVIIEAYLHWGKAAFSRLRGMFAFALYDMRNALIYLVRDGTGIKPLYYHLKDDTLSFSSEVRALNIAGFATEPDENWMVRFLAYGHIPEPYTTFKNVYSLPKGNFLCWNLNTFTCNIEPYFEDAPTTKFFRLDQAHENINASLKNAVKRQLLADAPIGVFLSGGVDSSLLTLLASQEKDADLKTISIYFDEKEYDERAYQDLVMKSIGGEKFSHLITQREFENSFARVIADMDMPTTDGINTWFISKCAHEEGLKAVISGIGADELFGGYPSFSRIKYLKLLRTVPSIILKKAGSLTADRYKKLSYLQSDHLMADYLLLRGLFAAVDIAKILNLTVTAVNDILFDTAYNRPRQYDKEQAAWFEENIYMENQLLRDTDIMGMSHGLEVRVPFLDEDFQNVVKRIDASVRFDNKQPKKLLIDSFPNYLPAQVWNRPKMGFTFPLQTWMRQLDAISNENLYQNKTAKQVIKKFRAGQMHWSKAFALYHIQMHV